MPYPTINPAVNMPRFFKLRYGLLISFIGFILFAAGMAGSSFILLLGMLCIPGGIVLPIVGYSRKSKRIAELTEVIRCSEEFRRGCAEVDEQNKQRQIQLDKELQDAYMQRCEEYKMKCEEHRQSLQMYEESVKYHRDTEIPEWSEELAALNTALVEAKSALKELYDRNIIPMKYRNHAALFWIATFLDTSQFDLKYTIERFDEEVNQLLSKKAIQVAEAQRELMKDQLQTQRYIAWQNELHIELTEQSNATLSSISNWQKADVTIRLWDRHKAKRAAKKMG
jgi:hypothetical protein